MWLFDDRTVPAMNGPLPGPRGRALLERDERYMSPSYTRIYPLVCARGSGAVIIWDEGTVDLVRNEPGHLSFMLHGHKLAGGFALTRTGERRWILVKARDEQARPGSDITAEQPASVRSGRTYEQLLSDG